MLHTLTSALDEGEWSVSLPGRSIPGERSLYPLERRLGGPQLMYITILYVRVKYLSWNEPLYRIEAMLNCY
jgi:hypothetical protein